MSAPQVWRPVVCVGGQTATGLVLLRAVASRRQAMSTAADGDKAKVEGEHAGSVATTAEGTAGADTAEKTAAVSSSAAEASTGTATPPEAAAESTKRPTMGRKKAEKKIKRMDIPSTVYTMYDEMQEVPKLAAGDALEMLCPKDILDLPPEKLDGLKNEVSVGFTTSQLRRFMSSAGLSKSGTKAVLVQRIMDYWMRQAAVHMPKEYTWVEGQLRRTITVSPDDPSILERINDGNIEVVFNKKTGSGYIAGTFKQLESACAAMKGMLDPYVVAVHWPQGAGQQVTESFLDTLEKFTGTLITRNSAIQDDGVKLRIIGREASDTVLAASAIEHALGLYISDSTHLSCLHEAASAVAPDAPPTAYSMMPIYDTLAMPMLPRYSEPFRIVSTATKAAATVEETEESVNIIPAAPVTNTFTWLQSDAPNESVDLDQICAQMQHAAQNAAARGSTVTADAEFGRAFFFDPHVFGLADALAVPNMQRFGNAKVASLLSQSNYRSAFLATYAASSILGRPSSLVHPRQFIELEYAVPASHILPTGIAEGVRVRMGAQEDGSCTLLEAVWFEHPLRVNILAPSGRADISLRLKAESKLNVPTSLDQQLSRCTYAGKRARTATIVNAPNQLEQGLTSQMLRDIDQRHKGVLTLRAIRLISEESQPWRGLSLVSRRIDERRTGTSLNQGLLSGTLFSHAQEPSTPIKDPQETLQHLATEALRVAYEQ
ncbi:hypothetical protein THASP1DRAFT_31733 [Thamnocephalis sphaerospora]|uniref:SAP domain-containing protein n=1 Tax=Thamnocephalis sphaerospora TaxID=78915 RepID=A0A4P9XKV4_9FUNG|nr:hypothetical protein THASP1DRAFT_31733 [Thamnocephalis sphaerospora]|eukprot:RKP06447.1 hypothetical protein THASP1DRAFT_31733 [Thamnocephalis sphaerospora]